MKRYWNERFGELNPEQVKKVETDAYGFEKLVISEEDCPAYHSEKVTGIWPSGKILRTGGNMILGVKLKGS